ncbi:hypothetical protein NDU88_006235 [Pleurodeles waltl]|uniref:Uncharacterized protein n=1 Tax=Pleurodeles waltl TaxID=8319 RepID=A0AAV7MGY4_PLEWA|nr:hypothetical protein NDU88_006235 [Pleurodeles waltl]
MQTGVYGLGPQLTHTHSVHDGRFVCPTYDHALGRRLHRSQRSRRRTMCSWTGARWTQARTLRGTGTRRVTEGAVLGALSEERG